jgi:murein DD-endopeptidase
MLLRQDRYRAYTPPYLLYGLLGVSLLMNLYMVTTRPSASEDPDAVVAAMSPPVDDGQPTLQSRVAEVETVSVSAAGGAGEWQLMRGEVTRSLGHTFASQLEHGSEAMTAVFGRLATWELDLRRDIQKGDVVHVLWRLDSEGELELGAASLESGKKGQTIAFYRYKAPGDRYESYWNAAGTEVPLRLVGGPIEDYEQITSLFRDDRKNHKGMDFKADVGTDVVSPKAATVTRVNWKNSGNGNCIEVRYADGTLARFLHLDEVLVEAGHHVKSGQVIAKSGNTGRSSAPHLHYELSRNGTPIDPMDYHDTIRRQLDEASMKKFSKEVARIDALLGARVEEETEG